MMKHLRKWLIITGFAVLLWGGEYLRRGLWEPDEARFGYISKEMNQTDEWLVMHRHGELYPDKPPLMFWMINAFSFVTGGEVTQVSTRLPSLVGAILSLWVVVTLGTRWRNERVGWLAGLILATSFLFWQVAGMGQLDSLLCGLEMMALYLLLSNDERPSVWRPLLAYIFIGLAIITKGPVGVAIPLGAYITMRLVSGQKQALRKWHWAWGLVVAAAFPAAWLVAAWLDGAPREYLNDLLFGQVSRRVVEGTGHGAPFYYFLFHFPLEFLPWTLLLPAACVAMWRSEEQTSIRRQLLGWFLFVVVFFSIPVDKRNLYILFAFPAAALFLAIAWDEILKLPSAWIKWTVGVTISFMLVCGITGVFAGLFHEMFSAMFPEDLQGLVAHLCEHAMPWGILLLAGAVVLWLQFLRNGAGGRWIWIAAVVFLFHQIYVANVIYPTLNPLKTPVALAEAAKANLRPDQRLFLFRINGEILALYSDRWGRKIVDVDKLNDVMEQEGSGIVVFEGNIFERARGRLTGKFVEHPFRMGNKKMVWIEFGDSSRAAPDEDAATKGLPEEGNVR